MTGSAIVIPLLAASGASAADGTTWDRVAQCESGGAWSADQGNGYYGGLQLDQADWEAYGGLAYAPRADQASRSQQIAVAEKLLDDRGLAAWPTCGPLSGLSEGSAGVPVDTGVVGGSSAAGSDADSYVSAGLSTSTSSTSLSNLTGSTDSGDSSGVTGGAAKPDVSPSPSASGQAAGKSDESGKSAQKGASSGTSDAASAGTGRHRGADATGSATGSPADSATGWYAASTPSAPSLPSASSDTVDNSYGSTNLWNVPDVLGLEDGYGDQSVADSASADAGPGLVVPGRSIAVIAETVQN
ncbi:transglycosylase family protein [Streptomyces sp. NPDC091209]|uniref:transglycosylase family protein n=1 Tax=Streptomyces sp. NPDC091209 TaxID=3365974 RepID=UPI003827B7F4